MTIQERSTPRTLAWRAALAGTTTLALLVLSASLPAAQAKSPTPPQQVAKVTGPQISIEGFKFSPAAVTVPVGTTVTWTNNGGELHTVTSSTSVFSSAGLEQDESFSYTFAAPGTYEYYCKLHPHMRATIVVN